MMQRKKLEFSVPKPGIMYLKGWLKDTQCIEITLQGKRLQHLSDNKYLGVTLSERLKGEKHVLDVMSRSGAKFQKLSRLSKKKWGLRSGDKLQLYRSVFIPKVTYTLADGTTS